MKVIWTDYLQYRAKLRGFDQEKLEVILAHSSERYYDTETGRLVIVGRYDNKLVLIPYEIVEDTITPVTVHTTTREQINFRLRAGRFTHE